MRDEVVGKSILAWLLRIFKLLRCTHGAVALELGNTHAIEEGIIHFVV